MDKRIYRIKDPQKRFFCPLCRTERGIVVSPRLTAKNYLQILLTSAILFAGMYSMIGVRGFAIFFVVWGLFELSVRSQFKKEIPCPHCGFDATWYHRDVKIARELVKKHHGTL